MITLDIYGFTPNIKVPFLKIYVPIPTLVATCKRVLEEGINIPGYGFHVRFVTLIADIF